MTTTQTAQQLNRCDYAMRDARAALALDDPRRIVALMAARDEIDATLRVLRWRPRSWMPWGRRATDEYPVAGRDACDCKGIAGDNGKCDDACRRAGLR